MKKEEWPKIRVPKEAEKSRLDVFLAKKFPKIPRKFFQTRIKTVLILVNGENVAPSRKLKWGDEIEFQKNFEGPQFPQADLLPDGSINFSVHFRNKDFAIIEKPAGISVHPSERELSGTLVNGLLAKFPILKNVGEDKWRPGIVHRLDKFTSGLMIIPLKQGSFEFFKESFQQRKIKKKYIAVCWGKFKQKEGVVDFFVGRSKSDPAKQAASKDPERLANPKEARTKYRVLEEGGGKSLVELAPKTGRKHQIRVHMHGMGHPLVGDFLYGNKAVRKINKNFSRFLLHAGKIEFADQQGKQRKFASDFPKEFLEILHQKNAALQRFGKNAQAKFP